MKDYLFIVNEGLIPFLCGKYQMEMHPIYIIFSVILCIVLPYLLGSLNFALIISRRFYGEDIRTKGSGNAGMTNMLRTYGKGAAALTLLGDMLKAVFASLFGYLFLGVTGAYLAGLFCILGHMFPIFYRFKGGKGVVTTAVMILMLNPIIFAILLLMFAIIVIGTRYISLGSVMCALLWPLLVHRIEGPGANVLLTIGIAALIVFMHRGNIKRLYEGKESKVSLKKKKKEEPTDE